MGCYNSSIPSKKESRTNQKILKTKPEKFNWKDVEFAMQLDKISIFEKNNPNYGISVYIGITMNKYIHFIYLRLKVENKKINRLMILKEKHLTLLLD